MVPTGIAGRWQGRLAEFTRSASTTTRTPGLAEDPRQRSRPDGAGRPGWRQADRV